MKKILKKSILWLLGGLFFSLIGTLTYVIYQVDKELTPTSLAQESVNQYSNDTILLSKIIEEDVDTFSISNLQNPPQKYAPWTRWWWTGADVDSTELKRELHVFAENGFAGVEIQATSVGLDKKQGEDVLKRRLDVGSKRYYQIMESTLKEAQKLKLSVDLTVGSGWPAGGAHVRPNDGLQTLVHGKIIVEGNKQIIEALPKPKMPVAYTFWGLIETLLGTSIIDYYADNLELVSVLAYPILAEKESFSPFSLENNTQLDAKKVIVLDKFVKDKNIVWQAPEGKWAIISIYQMPSGETPTLSAQRPIGLVIDHFDSTKIKAHYNYLLGKQTPLYHYFGKPIRAFFNDSFEFKTERHFSKDFLAYFRAKRGYDLTPHLPSVLMPAADNWYFDLWQIKRKPYFSLNEQDIRIRHDYSQTVSDLFIEHFLQTSNSWALRNGLKSRAQSYGIEMDIIKAAGHTQIPETEQLYAGGTEMFLKMVSSGAALYNRNTISAETAVHIDRDYMTTPQKLKCNVDKLFISGINQVIFHGSPYLNQDTTRYGEAGWHPFSSPYSVGHFSSNISEKDAFWQFQKPLNKYISRVQFALQQGKPSADILVYYPFMGFSGSFLGEKNHKEFLFNGMMPNVEPAQAGNDAIKDFVSHLFNLEPHNQRSAWLKNVWRYLQVLENQGFTWQWVNDESLQAAIIDDGKLTIRNNQYKMVILPPTESIALETAMNLAKLRQANVPIIGLEQFPNRQHSFFNYLTNDVKIQEVFKGSNFTLIKKPEELANFSAIQAELVTTDMQSIRYTTRLLANNQKLFFLTNFSDEAQVLKISANTTDNGYAYYWLDPLTGNIFNAEVADNKIEINLNAYTSMVLLFVKPNFFQNSNLPQKVWNGKQEVLSNQIIKNWNLSVLGTDVLQKNQKFEDENFTLKDWRTIPALQFSSSHGVYTKKVIVKDLAKKGENYVLDLGEVYFATEIKVNRQAVGQVFCAPYQLNINKFLIQGENEIEIKIIPALRNRFIGFAKQEKDNYKQFKGLENTILPAGLVGEVKLLKTTAQ